LATTLFPEGTFDFLSGRQPAAPPGALFCSQKMLVDGEMRAKAIFALLAVLGFYFWGC